MDECLKEILAGCKEAKAFVATVAGECGETSSSGQNRSEGGISLLDVKNHQLLDYLTNLTSLMLRKVEGGTIAGCDEIERLVEIRTVLERLKPLEQKIQYQLEKLTSLAANKDAGGKIGVKPGPRPQDLESGESSGAEDSDAEMERQVSAKARKYQPPKLVAVPYNEGLEGLKEGKEGPGGKTERVRIRRSVVEELRQQYSSVPEEVIEEGRRRGEAEAEARRRTQYEEEYMVRVQMGRAQKQQERRAKAGQTLDALLHLESHDDASRARRRRNASVDKKKSKKKRESFKGSKKKRK